MNLAPDGLSWSRALPPALLAQNDAPEAGGAAPAPAPGDAGAPGDVPAVGEGGVPAVGEGDELLAGTGDPDGGDLGGQGTSPSPSFAPMLWMIGLMFLVFYFLMIRPERRRQRAHEQLLKNIKKGDTVTTTAGIVGRIQRVEDKEVVVQVDKESNTRIRFLKSAVADVRRGGETAPGEKSGGKPAS